MIKLMKQEYQLTCDKCGKESETGEAEIISVGWHFDTWNAGEGYVFHALTCSAECRVEKILAFVHESNQIAVPEVDIVTAIKSLGYLVEIPPYRQIQA